MYVLYSVHVYMSMSVNYSTRWVFWTNFKVIYFFTLQATILQYNFVFSWHNLLFVFFCLAFTEKLEKCLISNSILMCPEYYPQCPLANSNLMLESIVCRWLTSWRRRLTTFSLWFEWRIRSSNLARRETRERENARILTCRAFHLSWLSLSSLLRVHWSWVHFSLSFQHIDSLLQCHLGNWKIPDLDDSYLPCFVQEWTVRNNLLRVFSYHFN